MKSSINVKSWKTIINLSALLFLVFVLTVLNWRFIGVSTLSSSSSLASPSNGSITYDDGANVITVTGYSSRTPCTFNDLWNADKAGTQGLVHARAITDADAVPIAVNHALRPTDYYVLGLGDVYITITNFTANSTIQIVGTEEYGVAQTENIAITGNGTYNSTKYWRTIVSTQVTVFSGSFTYTLTQGQWGVIWQTGATHYQVDCKLVIGDGSTTTTFSDTDKQIVFSALAVGTFTITVAGSATFQLGTLEDLTSKTTSNGCSLNFLATNSYIILQYGSNGIVLFYSSQFTASTACGLYCGSSSSKIWNCILTQNVAITYWGGDVFNVNIEKHSSDAISFPASTATFNKVFVSDCSYALFVGGSIATSISNLYARRCTSDFLHTYFLAVDVYLVDADTDLWTINWGGSSGGNIYRQYTFDLKATDKDDNAISGATVTLKDKNGTQIFSVTTNASGDIAQQTVSRGYYNQPNGNTLQDYSPHTFTISKGGYQTFTGNFTLSQKTNWRIALQPLTGGGLIEHVGLVPVDPSLTSPSGTYRWLDVADQAYGVGYRNSYNYSQAAVEVAYCAEGNKLQGLLQARNLKPNFAYQLKLVGIPGTADNEHIGLAGRWWQEEWNGTTWANGQNLNDKGDGSSPNPNDQTYLNRSSIQDSTSPTGYHYRYTGYLVFDYFITDSNGSAMLQFETGSCYHVMWKTTQRSNSTNDGPVKTVTFDPAPSQAYDTDYPSNTVSIFGEWERLPMGQVNLQPGEYNCQILLTEESFHGSGGTLAGNWDGAVTVNIIFTVN